MPDGTHHVRDERLVADLTRFGCDIVRLDDGWQLTALAPGSVRHPGGLPDDTTWANAPAPENATAILGRDDLDSMDVWYRTRIPPGPPERRIRFGGLATLAEAWIDGAPFLLSDNMFVAQERALPQGCEAGSVLHLCLRALAAPPGLPRPRWRTRFAEPDSLRGLRTTLMGRLSGQKRAPIIGPWRPVEILTPIPGLSRFGLPRIKAELAPDGTGRLALRLPLAAGALPPRTPCALHIAGQEAPLIFDGEALTGEASLPGIAPWWPHTHGMPALHALAVTIEGAHRLDLGRIGFRRIEVDRGHDGRGFALRINGEPVFCRGAAWTDAPRVNPSSLLSLARDAGLNMIRLPGTGCYADEDFIRACDDLGLLVWQDFMFARLHYPTGDARFRANVEAEARQVLAIMQGAPSLAVLCGGSEVAQQAAMLGLPEDTWSSPLFGDILPGIVASLRPDVPYVPNAPCGPAGELPFRVDGGIAHDFGIGGYLLPLSSARTSGMRFAAECVAFSHVPDAAGTEALGAAPNTPEWKAGIPRDANAAWDFEDVRERYLAELYRVQPSPLRRSDPERWLALSRAVTGDAIEAAYAAWRSPASGCGGALLIALQDTVPGAGWGVVDAAGRPKPAWHAMRRASRPVQLLLFDEGLNGIALHALNETALPLQATLSIDCWRGAVSVARGRLGVTIPARGSLSLSGETLFGGFFDAMGTWRFGPLRHEVVVARLDAAGADGNTPPLATASLFPGGRGLARHDVGLTARLVDERTLIISTTAFAECVQIEDEAGFLAAEDFFHLAPGQPCRVALRPGPGAGAKPQGRVVALNCEKGARYGALA